MTIYKTRYRAVKDNPGKVVFRVDGGFAAMWWDDYKAWKRTK